MKTKKLLTVLLCAFCASIFVADTSDAKLFGWFRKSDQPAAGQTKEHTRRKGKIMRGFRYLKQRMSTSCDSTNAGRIDGFRRCLTSSLGKGMDIDKRSSVLALDKTGKPLSKSINRVRFKQEWFRRQMVLSNLSQSLLSAMLTQQQAIAEAQAEQKEAEESGDSGDTKSDGMDEKMKIMDEILESYENQLTDVWVQYGALQKQMGQDPEYTGQNDETPMSPVPMPDAANSLFSPSKTETGPVMSSAFAASMDQFAQKNPNVMHNFCYNFFAVGPEAGYEADYVRMADVGDIKTSDVEKYQDAKMSIIAIKCSQNSMIGLFWRKLYDLCPMGAENQTIDACSGFDDSETATTLYTGG